MNEKEKLEYPKYLWDGSVGVRIDLSKNKMFLTWAPVRRYKDEKTGKWKYPVNFSTRNEGAFYKISELAFRKLEEFDRMVQQNSQVPVAKISISKVPESKAIAA